MRLTWKKLPDLPELKDEHRRFLGLREFARLDCFPGCIGPNACRGYEFGDGTLTLRPPARQVDGRTVQDALTWERLEE